jgi:UDP-3-O-[3-hydroxymyristoyl] N-acetylglucosamine deacetylase
MQRTIKNSVTFQSVALHSGKLTRITLRPQAPNVGIVFKRTDLPSEPIIPGLASQVLDTILATRLGSPTHSISTVEHLLAAVYSVGISNLLVEVDGPEIPIADGSSLPFLVMLDEAGIETQGVPSRFLRVKSPLEVVCPKDPTRFIRIEPSKHTQITYTIDFAEKSIGSQTMELKLSGETLAREILFARTFCRFHEIEYLKSRGLAQGGSLENAVVVGNSGGSILNRNGLRAENEFVRHKILDCVGDLALVGMPVVGSIYAHKAGHDLHTALAKKLEILAKTQAETVDVRSKKSFSLQFPESLRQLGIGLNFNPVVG